MGISNCNDPSVAARRVGALVRHLQTRASVIDSNSGLGVSAVPVYAAAAVSSNLAFSAGKESFETHRHGYDERGSDSRTNSELSIGERRVERIMVGEAKIKIQDPNSNGELDQPPREKVILVIGAGDATGGALAKRFAKEGYIACIVRRHVEKLKALADEIIASGGQAYSFGVDARKEEEMVTLVQHIERDIGEIHVSVFNIGANVNFSILETTSRVYLKVWEMACFSGFLTGRESAKYMVSRNKGTIIFTGATASIRGGTGYAAFAGAKFALRALAQSMARELGPKGIHVAHVIIDAPIDTAWTRENIPRFDSRIDNDGAVQPEDIAEVYWQLHQQPRRAWTHEIDLRPYNEPW